MSTPLHDALHTVVKNHLLSSHPKTTVASILKFLDTDDKLFWFLGQEKKTLKSLKDVKGKKLLEELEKHWDAYIKEKDNL